MGIIRLTLITAALIWLAMYYFGRDEGLPENRLGRAPTPAELAPAAAEAPEAVSVPAPATPAAPAPAPEATTPESPAPTDPVASAIADALAAPEPLPEPEPASTPEPVAEPAPEPEPEPEVVLYVSGRVVNVRAGPATTFEAISSLPRGSAVVDLGDAGEGWRQIQLATGEIGYMSGDFLSPDPQ